LLDNTNFREKYYKINHYIFNLYGDADSNSFIFSVYYGTFILKIM
jgi:hypothetical protein